MIVMASTLLGLLVWSGCILSDVGVLSNDAVAQPLTFDQLIEQLEAIRGDDTRIVRWDATEYTHHAQRHGGCDALPNAFATILATTNINNDDDEEEITKGLACEYATFCITDNPTLRATMSQNERLYPAIVRLVSSPHPATSASASHLLYNAVFANRDNQYGFYNAGAIQALSSVITNDNDQTTAVSIMWAASALQNLLASYCDTKNNGRCFWDWYNPREEEEEAAAEKEFVLMVSTPPVSSDGAVMRRAVLDDIKLIQRLIELSCTGPVRGEPSQQNPFVGETAHTGRHDNHTNIIAWAATGVLKNLALAVSSGEINNNAVVVASVHALLEDAMPCFCRMSHSRDWLERNKGQGVLKHLRRTDPCWFRDRRDAVHSALCIDAVVFQDAEGYQCDEYGGATSEECEATNVVRQSSPSPGEFNPLLPAKEACCGCGGGRHIAPVVDDQDADAIKREL